MIKAKITTAHGEGLVIGLSRQNCERLYAGPYAELFARRQRDGWSCFGDQLPQS